MSDTNLDQKAWDVIDKFVDAQKDAEKKKHWRQVLLGLFVFLYLGSGFYMYWLFAGPSTPNVKEEHIAFIDLQGVIAEGEEASSGEIVGPLRSAFEAEYAKAIIIGINSPGGSVVQSGYIYNEIKRLRAEHPDKKVYAVIRDIGASGGYYVALATDAIYAHESSLVGSIGVTASGFGDAGLMEKLGIERRHYTAGENKSFLDPFSPINQDQAAFWQGVLETVHEQFIEKVKSSRGEKLNGGPELFSGLIWNGSKALELGLIDGMESAGTLARRLIESGDIVVYNQKKPSLSNLFTSLGASFGEGFTDSVIQAASNSNQTQLQYLK